MRQRIEALEEALAEYAGLYGLTPRARAVFAQGSVDDILARRDAATSDQDTPQPPAGLG